MKGIAIEQEFRMPLQADEESVSGQFDGLDNAVRRLGADNESRRGLFDRLVMRAIHANCPVVQDPGQSTAGNN